MKRLKSFLQRLGPGFITGAADDDPSGIATFAQTGALLGYRQLWVALFTFPLMVIAQEMSGRIGLVTGKGLAGVIKSHYSRTILYTTVSLVVIANVINIGADLGAMASSLAMLIPLPFTLLLLIITAITLVLEIYVSYQTYARYLKFLAFSLLIYVVAAFAVKQDWPALFQATFIPSLVNSKIYWMNFVALLGTTISPYLFFWQASEEVEEEVAHHKLNQMGHGHPHFSKIDLSYLRLDTIWGMFFSNLITFFIIATSAATLYPAGIHTITTASQAAEALRPLAGQFTFLLFTLGILGTGFLAVPILAGSASYALSEVLGLREGLYRKFPQARGFYGIIIAATLLGVFLNFTPLKPFTLLYYAAIFNGLVAAPLLAVILLVANNKRILGNFTNSRRQNFWGIVLLLVMAGAAIFLFI